MLFSLVAMLFTTAPMTDLALGERGITLLQSVANISNMNDLENAMGDMKLTLPYLGGPAKAAPVFTFLGSVFALIGPSLPDAKHKQLLEALKNLDSKISTVSKDVQQLEAKVYIMGGDLKVRTDKCLMSESSAKHQRNKLAFVEIYIAIMVNLTLSSW